MQHFEIVMVLVRQGDVYHLQLRSGSFQSGALGKVGSFGGEIEPNETPEAAACRELAEESTLDVQAGRLRYLTEVNVASEKHNRPATVHAMVYEVILSETESIDAREGECVTWTLTEMIGNATKLTPAMKAVVKILEEK